MLKIENLRATVADKPILKGLSLSINAGEIHSIMGPNGAGKSTLSYVLGGRPGYEVTEGSVNVLADGIGEQFRFSSRETAEKAAERRILDRMKAQDAQQ